MAANQIKLKGRFRDEEARAAAAITPGHLIELDSNGKVKKHAVEGGYAERAFAIESALQGKTIADAYAAEELVSYALAEPGAEVYAWLKAGENVGKSDKLISAGDGTFIKNGSEATATTVRQIVLVALEALDLTATGAVAGRIRARVL